MNEFYNKMKCFEETEGIKSEIYYHYTSLDALYNIVKHKTFRLTSLKTSNDRTELYYNANDFVKDIADICDSEKDSNTKEYLCIIRESLNLHKEEFFNECKRKKYPYALCLSEKVDNLTHWDRYAEKCSGVCIGVNVSALRVMMQRMAITTFGNGVYDVGKTIYSSEKRKRFIKNALVNILNAFCKYGGVKENITEMVRKNGYIYAASTYIQAAKFVKNSSFVDEDEVRLYHDATSIKGTLDLIERMKLNLEPELYINMKHHFNEFVRHLNLDEEMFYVATNGIRSYKNLCLKEVWGSGTIPEIILGPLCPQNKSELKRFLNANGLEGTKVYTSKVPIR